VVDLHLVSSNSHHDLLGLKKLTSKFEFEKFDWKFVFFYELISSTEY
jgi:hypothetical protein